jgi:hypothetical protein
MRESVLSAGLLLAGLAAAHAQGAAPADQNPGVPPASAYRGGAGAPFSPRASNIDGADTYSEIAPRLPDPYAAGDGPRAYLVAAQRALDHRQTGAAQEALERAQTRILSRSTDPAFADRPDDRGLSRAITDARLALGQHDVRRAQAILAQVLTPRR